MSATIEQPTRGLMKRLEETIKGLGATFERLRSRVDSLNGPEPIESSEKDQKPPVQFRTMEYALRDLEKVAQDIDHQVSRLEEAL